MFEAHLLRDANAVPGGTVTDADPNAAGSDDPELKQPEKEKEVPEAERTVPYGALKEERHARRKLEQQVSTLSTRIEQLAASLTKPTAEYGSGDLDPETVQKWEAHLKKLPTVQRLEKAAELVEELKANRPHDEATMNVALNNYYDTLTSHALKTFDQVYPPNPEEEYAIDRETFSELVAAKLTVERMDRISAGDRGAFQEAVDQVMDRLKKVNKTKAKPKDEELTREKELTKNRSLPRTPGPGGANPPPPADAPVPLKDLHKRAHARLQGSFARMNKE